MSRTAAQVRQDFLDFFRDRGHAIVDGSPVVPYDDPTLLFTNAGMNQFKDVFLGAGARSYRRAADTQPCIRAGGKHNDLDDVGHDTYHHTFFEMLGNWSFGDYFKKESIEWAWELLTKVWGLDPNRLHATYFGGDPDKGLEPDLEARALWLAIPGMTEARVHPGNMKDNFWEMGDTGPCGPCSEVHVDLTPDLTGGPLVNAGDQRVIEIWNLVFIQFNRAPDGNLTPLPDKHVDTGMGLERVSAVIQGHNNNYATDVFAQIIQAIEKLTGHQYGAKAAPVAGHADNRYARFSVDDMGDVACRVIADHIRTLTFALTDGAMPDKDGRGYVLRRILRRAVRYGWQHLALREPFLCKLAPVVVDAMGEAFPKLRKSPARVIEVVREEEESFNRTLDRGLALFETAAAAAMKHSGREVSGEDAFKLYDTFGFPRDLTEIMARERGLGVDHAEYDRLMEEARQRSRAAGKGDAAAFAHVDPAILAKLPPTDDALKHTAAHASAALRAILVERGGNVALLDAKQTLTDSTPAALIFDRTCFYGEQGGQVGDIGRASSDAAEFAIHSTLRFGEVVAHVGHLTRGVLKHGDTFELEVDARRELTRSNHTATHLLNWALRETLGEHVDQRGSLVDPEKTRFDFSHPAALTTEQIERIEALVNQQIDANHRVFAEEAAEAEARKINSLRAVFGEKYPDRVRVVSIGPPVGELLATPDRAEWRQYSIEFCGGTHVRATGEIERFRLTGEESVAKGVRRVVGVSGAAAWNAERTGKELRARAEALHSVADTAPNLHDQINDLQEAAHGAALPVGDRHALRDAIAELQKALKQQQKAAAGESLDQARDEVERLIAGAQRVGDASIVVGRMPNLPVDQLKAAADIAKQKLTSAAVLFGVDADGKAMLIASVSPDLVKRGVKAGDLIKAIAPIVEGGGGGPPTMAQAGGKNPAKLGEALEAGREWLHGKLG